MAGLLSLALIGRRVDSHPQATALVVTGGLAICMVLLLVGSSSPLLAGAAVVLWAVPSGGMSVVLQAAVLRTTATQPDLASAVYIVAFQLGIAATVVVRRSSAFYRQVTVSGEQKRTSE